MQPRDKVAILKRAYELLARPYGWTRRRWIGFDRRGRGYREMCLSAACQQAALDLGYEGLVLQDPDTPVAKAVGLHDRIVGNGYWSSIPHYNDAMGRKKQEILALVGEQIADLEQAKTPSKADMEV